MVNKIKTTRKRRTNYPTVKEQRERAHYTGVNVTQPYVIPDYTAYVKLYQELGGEGGKFSFKDLWKKAKRFGNFLKPHAKELLNKLAKAGVEHLSKKIVNKFTGKEATPAGGGTIQYLRKPNNSMPQIKTQIAGGRYEPNQYLRLTKIPNTRIQVIKKPRRKSNWNLIVSRMNKDGRLKQYQPNGNARFALINQNLGPQALNLVNTGQPVNPSVDAVLDAFFRGGRAAFGPAPPGPGPGPGRGPNYGPNVKPESRPRPGPYQQRPSKRPRPSELKYETKPKPETKYSSKKEEEEEEEPKIRELTDEELYGPPTPPPEKMEIVKEEITTPPHLPKKQLPTLKYEPEETKPKKEQEREPEPEPEPPAYEPSPPNYPVVVVKPTKKRKTRRKVVEHIPIIVPNEEQLPILEPLGIEVKRPEVPPIAFVYPGLNIPITQGLAEYYDTFSPEEREVVFRNTNENLRRNPPQYPVNLADYPPWNPYQPQPESHPQIPPSWRYEGKYQEEEPVANIELDIADVPEEELLELNDNLSKLTPEQTRQTIENINSFFRENQENIRQGHESIAKEEKKLHDITQAYRQREAKIEEEKRRRDEEFERKGAVSPAKLEEIQPGEEDFPTIDVDVPISYPNSPVQSLDIEELPPQEILPPLSLPESKTVVPFRPPPPPSRIRPPQPIPPEYKRPVTPIRRKLRENKTIPAKQKREELKKESRESKKQERLNKARVEIKEAKRAKSKRKLNLPIPKKSYHPTKREKQRLIEEEKEATIPYEELERKRRKRLLEKTDLKTNLAKKTNYNPKKKKK